MVILKIELKVLFFLGVVKKGGEFLRPIKKKVFMVAEAPNGTPPVFYYIMI